MSPPKTSWRKRRKFILGKVVRYSFTFSYILHSDTTSKMQILLSKRFFDACRCVNKSQIIVSFVCTSQSKSRPPPQPGKRQGLGQKNSIKCPQGKCFHSNVLAFPRLPEKTYSEVPIFIWWKCFKPVWFSFFYWLIWMIIIWNKGKYKSSWFQKF